MNELFQQIAHRTSRTAGSSWAFMVAATVIIVWAISGPVFGFSDTWQLVINTGTTIVTFLMVFLIQRSQNKDSTAVHLKLNELVAAVQGASNRLINVEDLSEQDEAVLKRHYGKLVELALQDAKLTECHSIEEATHRHEAKHGRRTQGKNRERQAGTSRAAAAKAKRGRSKPADESGSARS